MRPIMFPSYRHDTRDRRGRYPEHVNLSKGELGQLAPRDENIPVKGMYKSPTRS